MTKKTDGRRRPRTEQDAAGALARRREPRDAKDAAWLERKRRYNAKHRDKLRAKARRYHHANKDKARAYYEANKERINAYSMAWQKAHPERTREIKLAEHKRNAKDYARRLRLWNRAWVKEIRRKDLPPERAEELEARAERAQRAARVKVKKRMEDPSFVQALCETQMYLHRVRRVAMEIKRATLRDL